MTLLHILWISFHFSIDNIVNLYIMHSEYQTGRRSNHLEDAMGDWNDLNNFAQYRRDELAAEAETNRLSVRRQAGKIRLSVLTLAVILLGMIAWWGR